MHTRFSIQGNHPEKVDGIAYDAARQITFDQFASVREYLSVPSAQSGRRGNPHAFQVPTSPAAATRWTDPPRIFK